MPIFTETIFFDFDGVLVDSVDIKKHAFKNLFERFGQELSDQLVAYHQKYGGISRVKKIQYFFEHLLKQPLSRIELDIWCSRFSEKVKDAVINAPWIPGAENFLKKYIGKIPMYIISGTPHSELTEIVLARNMTHYLEGVYGSPTPKTEHVLNIIDQKNLSRKSCYFIGDAMTDYNTALETGLNFIGIQGENKFPEDTSVFQDCNNLDQYIFH